MGNIIEFENVSKVLGGRQILKDVTFEVQEGEIFGIIGLSGSGKTTVLHNMIGFLQPSTGNIRFQKVFKDQKTKRLSTKLVNMNRHFQEVKQTFGFAPQKASFYPQLTVIENLLHFGSLYNVKKKHLEKTSHTLLHLTKLSKYKHSLSEHLSGGQQKRLSIICSLVQSPEVLILDEPTSDLDPILREEMWSLIREINKQGKTIIIASHFLEELEKVCDSVAILHNGEIIRKGSLATVTATKDGHDEVIIRTAKEHHSTIMKELKRNTKSINHLKYTNSQIVFRTSNAYEVMVAIALMMKKDKGDILDVEIKQPGLKEIFSKLLS